MAAVLVVVKGECTHITSVLTQTYVHAPLLGKVLFEEFFRLLCLGFTYVLNALLSLYLVKHKDFLISCYTYV